MGTAQCASCCTSKDGVDDKQAMTKVTARSAWTEDVEQMPLPQGLEPVADQLVRPAATDESKASWPSQAGAAHKTATSAPDTLGRSYRLTLDRSPTETIGINLDLTDGVSLVVVDIFAGSIQAWNEAHASSPHLEINDRIVEANGLHGDADRMLAALKQNTTWALAVQRPVEYRAAVDRRSALSLGMDLRYAPNGTTLTISEVEDGPIKDWNACSTTWKVKKFDRIIELNGVRGSAQRLLQAGMEKDMLELCILHYEG